jgi:peptidoglycan/LPS O-acetylase OafA/YrhL
MFLRRAQCHEHDITPVRPTYRPDVDGLRAIAVITVVAYHTGISWLPGGYLGVDIFFVISGYLITGLLLADIRAFDRILVMDFYARRFRRILPTLVLVVLVTVFTSALLLSAALGEVQRVSGSAIAALLFSANLWFFHLSANYFSVGADYEPLLHTWSLSVEEQFYFLWPALLAATHAVTRRSRSPALWLNLILIAVIVASLACAIVLSFRHDELAFYFTAARAWELGTGGLLATAPSSFHRIPRQCGLAASFLGLGLIVAGVALISPDRVNPILLIAVAVTGTALIIFGNTVHANGPVGRLLSSRPMVAVGLASYAWYLWHWPALSIVRILTVGETNLGRDCIISACTLVLSFLTLHWYERPLRYHAGRLASAGRVVLTGCGATAFVAGIALGVHTWSHHVHFSPAERALQQARNDIDHDGCLLSLGTAETASPAACLIGGNQPRLLLWGDSIADRLYPALREWTSHDGGTVEAENLTKQGCPPLAEVMPTEPLIGLWKPYRGCRAFDDWVLGTRAPLAGNNRRSGVLIAAKWWMRATDLDMRPLGRTERKHSFDVTARTTEASLAALEHGLRSAFHTLTGRGLRVVIVLQTPTLISSWGHKFIDAPACLFRRSDSD